MKNKPHKHNRHGAPAPDRRSHGSGAIWLYGQHAVFSALQAGRRQVFEVWASKKYETALTPLLPGGVSLKACTPQELEQKFPQEVHQGIAARVGPLPQLQLPDVLNQPLLVMLDQVSDPHNLGAVLRSAAAFGAGAVIVPQHGSAPLSPVALKAAAGGAEVVPVIQVTNLAKALQDLQKEAYWSVGLAGEATEELAALDLAGRKVVLVLGSEGDGLRPLLAKNCDYLAKINMPGQMESLNVSVAAGIALYQLTRRS